MIDSSAVVYHSAAAAAAAVAAAPIAGAAEGKLLSWQKERKKRGKKGKLFFPFKIKWFKTPNVKRVSLFF